jgi:hypothetical protein
MTRHTPKGMDRYGWDFNGCVRPLYEAIKPGVIEYVTAGGVNVHVVSTTWTFPI